MSIHLNSFFYCDSTLRWGHFDKGLRLETESKGYNQMGKRNQNLKPISKQQKNLNNKGRGLSLITRKIHGFFNLKN